ncbi:MAG: hypothetical protein Q8R55_08060 [Candidatus Taylorbacteria bacterium]|nr:hypothetical protein [Candidatus Taylorbacteria bacterium]
MRKFFLFSNILLLFAPCFVFAHGTNYLEFNPDSGQSLKVADVATPSQVFFAQNDFLGGFDVWLANSGSSGTATFALLNEQGSVLTSKAVAVPYIAETLNGTNFHVDFNSQLTVLADDKYSIRVTSSMPELRLYYSNRVGLIAHNAPFLSPYIAGVAKLGSEEQTFSFKYALYETTETSAPIISNVVWTIVSGTQMRVDFNANEPVDYRVEYGPSGQGYTQSTNFTGGYQFCAEGIALCSINISVSPNTAYQYLLTVKDSWGNQSQSSGTFISGQVQTPTPTPSPTPSTSSGPTPSASATPTGSVTPTPDSTSSPQASPTGSSAPPPPPPPPPSPQDKIAPIISNLRIVSVTDRSVKVAWTTNETANSHLLISTPLLITVTDASDPTMELEHLLEVTSGLFPDQHYVAKATSIDLGSNLTKASINFTTLRTAIPTPSSQSSPTNQQQSGVSTTSTTSSSGSNTGLVQWGTSSGGEPSDSYRVDVFDKNGKLVKTLLVAKGFNSAEVPGLADGEYSVIVYANNDGVFEKIDQPVQLKAGEKPFIKRLLAFWPYLLIAAALIGIFVWIRKRSRKVITPVVN